MCTIPEVEHFIIKNKFHHCAEHKYLFVIYLDVIVEMNYNHEHSIFVFVFIIIKNKYTYL